MAIDMDKAEVLLALAERVNEFDARHKNRYSNPNKLTSEAWDLVGLAENAGMQCRQTPAPVDFGVVGMYGFDCIGPGGQHLTISIDHAGGNRASNATAWASFVGLPDVLKPKKRSKAMQGALDELAWTAERGQLLKAEAKERQNYLNCKQSLNDTTLDLQACEARAASSARTGAALYTELSNLRAQIADQAADLAQCRAKLMPDKPGTGQRIKMLEFE